MVDKVVFFIAAAACLGGAFGVILSRNPVHAALSLIGTLFGIAIHFVNLGAHFLAAVQAIVYAGAIVVLFLFVIMLLGVDRAEDLTTDPIAGQRPLSAIAGLGILGAILATVLLTDEALDRNAIGQEAFTAPLDGAGENIEDLGRALFTDYLFAFEVTS